MSNSQRIILIITLLIGFTCCDSVIAEIIVEPFGFAASVEEDGEVEVELQLSNSGDVGVAFSINYDLIEAPDNRQAGPRRDDLGDVIHEFDVPNGGADEQKVGVSWDWQNDWMWISNNPNSSVVAVDPNDDYNVARTIHIPTPFNVACLNGHLYIINNDLSSIYHYDTDGENLGNIDLQLDLLGLIILPVDPRSSRFHILGLDPGSPFDRASFGKLCDSRPQLRVK